MNLSDLRVSLSKLVTRGDAGLERRAARLTALSNLFFERYGDGPVSLLRAPARINVLGEHVDYVSYLPTASLTFGSRERYALMMYRPSNEPIVRCASTSAQYEPASFSIFDTPRFGRDVETEWLNFLFAHGTRRPGWENYINGAVTFARGKFGQRIQNGFDFALDSDIPAGGGASSSSALVVLGGAAIRNVNGIAWTPEGLARDSALAEWFIGTRGGSMDHTTICLAQPASAVLIDYAAGETRRVELPDEPFEWITFFTRPADKGRDVMIEYNERAAVSRLLIPAILKFVKTVELLPETISLDSIRRDYPETFLQLERSFPALVDEPSRWPLKIRARALHHSGEVQRVARATHTLDSLTSDNTFAAMQTIGKLLDESHASLRDLYEVSIPEVEELIGIIREDAHVLGARLMGGGFGGNVLALTTREHSDSLVERVQKEYYAPRNRDGVREGSVMVSTPGAGLSDVDLNELWRDSIAGVDAPESLRALIDSAPISFNPHEIWPVIVAAGQGTRAADTGLTGPKPLAIVDGEPAVIHVLQSIREGLGETRPPVIIVSPGNEAAIRDALRGENVLFVTQPDALGTGDAVLNAHDLMQNFAGLALVVWGTQPVIRPQTYTRAVKLAHLFDSYEMVLPTTFKNHPYAPIRRNTSGDVESATETHLESAEALEFGETNIALFVLKSQTMFQVLRELRDRYWNESTGRYNRARGELGFPNELINALASRKRGVFASPFADPREEQGIKRLEDVSHCERFLSELKAEETAAPERRTRGEVRSAEGAV